MTALVTSSFVDFFVVLAGFVVASAVSVAALSGCTGLGGKKHLFWARKLHCTTCFRLLLRGINGSGRR